MSEWILVDLDNFGIGYSNSGVTVFRLVDLAPQKDEMETRYMYHKHLHAYAINIWKDNGRFYRLMTVWWLKRQMP